MRMSPNSEHRMRNAPVFPNKLVNLASGGLRQSLLMASNDNEYYQDWDYYQILEAARDSDAAALKSAYRTQVIKWHPDKFPGDEEKRQEAIKRMEKINKAWGVLKDPLRKERYDKFGDPDASNAAEAEKRKKAAKVEVDVQSPGGGGSKRRPLSSFELNEQDVDPDEMDIGGLFESLFGSSPFGSLFGGDEGGGGGRNGNGRTRVKRSRNSPEAGADIKVMTEIPFMTSIFGGQHKLIIKRQDSCKICKGTGVKPGSKVKTCGTCRGKGMVVTTQRTAFGLIQQTATCNVCRGVGESVEDPCTHCKGHGTHTESHELDIKIPAGVDDGATLKIKDAGDEGAKQGPRGDLYVEVKVKADPHFSRKDQDIHSEEEVNYVDAILGTRMEVRTVSGKADLVIPKGTQPGTTLTLKGQGVPKVNGMGQRGDHVVTVRVNMPKVVGNEERALLEKIRESKASEGRNNNIVLPQ